MDFSNRSAQPQSAAPSPQAAGQGPSKKTNAPKKAKLGKFGFLAGVAAVVILLVALIVAVAFGGADANESKLVDKNKLQAVFLNTGQVYFGKISTLNNKYFVVTDIYYLQTANSGTGNTAANANTSVSLVKLGCELHEPFDKMVINRDQVTFWENLQDGGQVAKAVSTFQKQNPNGQKCADQSNASSNTTNNVQSAGTNSGSGTTTNSSSTTSNP